MSSIQIVMKIRAIRIPRVLGVLAVTLLMIVVSDARAELSLPMVIGDHMVMQRDADVPIWGAAEPGKTVTVSFADQVKQTTADASGQWRVELDPMPANDSPHVLKVECDGETLTRKDVLVGEVWLCSGQSNMQFGLSHAVDGEAEVARASDPLLRLLRVENHVVQRGEDAVGKWAACSPASAEKFSAVGYYYGLVLREELGVPFGLISSAWGATSIESWTPIEVIREDDAYVSTRERDRLRERDRPRLLADYEAKVEQWKRDREDAQAAGKQLPQPPRMPISLRPQSLSGSLYDSMIFPLVPFAMRGAVWYQGESNVGRADQYQPMLARLVETWRQAWAQDQFYFGIVQLPNYRPVAEETGESAWAALREAQRLVAVSLPDAGLAVTIDLGDADNGHPKNKQGVGQRLARWALADVYGKSLADQGPVLQGAALVDGQVELKFADGPGELASLDGKEPASFALAGADKQWHWARAEVIGRRGLRVWSEDVPEPRFVRYAWADNPPSANLTDASGIPASPFQARVIHDDTTR